MAAKKKNKFFDKILTQNERVVAVDVGSRYVKIAVLHKRKDVIETAALDAEPIPYLSARGDITPAQVSAALATLLERNNIKNASFISLLPLEFVSVKRFEVPSISAEQIKQIVPFEAEKHLPFSLDRAVMDFDFLPLDEGDSLPDSAADLPEPTSEKAKDARKAAEKMEASGRKSVVTLAAVRRAVIPKFLELCNVKGCRQNAIDVNAFALYNSLVFSLRNNPADSLGGDDVLIDIGALRTEMILLSAENQELLFTRSISFGGDAVTDALANKLNVSFEEAEKIKCEDWENTASKAIAKNFDDIFDTLVSQISKSLKYIKKTGLSEKQKVVWLTGGTASVPGFVEFLEEKLAMPVRVFNPLPFVNAEQTKFPPQIFAAAIGGALRMIGETKIKIDLLPVDITKLQQIAIRKKRFIQLGIAAGVILSILLLIFSAKILFTNIERRRLKAEYLKISPEALKVDSLEKRNETLRIAVEKMEGLTDRKTSWTQVLKIIADSMSSNIWIDSISVDKKNYLTINANSIGMDYIAFKNKLNASIRFNDVQIVNSQKDRSGKFKSFKLRCKVIPDYKYTEEFERLRKELFEKLHSLSGDSGDAEISKVEDTNNVTKITGAKAETAITNTANVLTNAASSHAAPPAPPVKKPKKEPIFVPKPKEKPIVVPKPLKKPRKSVAPLSAASDIGAPVTKESIADISNQVEKLKLEIKKSGKNIEKELNKLPPKLQKLILEKRKKALMKDTE